MEKHEVQKALAEAFRFFPNNVRAVEMANFTRRINSTAKIAPWCGKPAGSGFTTTEESLFELTTEPHRLRPDEPLADAIVRVMRELVTPHVKALDIPYMVVVGVFREVSGNMLWMGCRLDPGLVEQHKWSV